MIAASPRLSVVPAIDAISSAIPSISRKIPKITASVVRLLLGLNTRMIPATALSTPTRIITHQSHPGSRGLAFDNGHPRIAHSSSPILYPIAVASFGAVGQP